MLNGRQINDSFIIVKHLSKIVDGKDLTEEELKFEEEMTFSLWPKLMAETLGETHNRHD